MQRHRLPAMASSISLALGLGFSSRRALAELSASGAPAAPPAGAASGPPAARAAAQPPSAAEQARDRPSSEIPQEFFVDEEPPLPVDEPSLLSDLIVVEDGVADESGIANNMCHAGWRVSGCVNGERGETTDPVGVATFEELVELTAIALEFGAFVEDLPERFLDQSDLTSDANLATELFLNIGRAGKMIRMHMCLDQPLQIEAARLDVGNHFVGLLK